MPKRFEARMKKRRLPSGAIQFYTYFRGRFWSLGPDEQVARGLLGEITKGGDPFMPVPPEAISKKDESLQGPTIGDLAKRYSDFAAIEYRGSSEADAVRVTMNRLVACHGNLRAGEFRVVQLEAFRDELVSRGLVRTTVNQCVGRVKRMLAWAAGKELIHPDVSARANLLKPLKANRSLAREPRERQPVAWESVEPVLAHVAREVRALILLQWHSGARSGEVLHLRARDIDRSNPEVWSARIERHKTAHRGHRRTLHFGPRAQEVLREFLDRVPRPAPDEPLFSPQRAERDRAVRIHQLRKTKVPPSQAERRPKPGGKRAERAAYDRCSYARAIVYGIEKANRARFGAALREALPSLCALQRDEVLNRVILQIPAPTSAEAPTEFRERLITQVCISLARAGVEPLVAPRTLRNKLREAVEAVTPIPHWHPHLLRHSLATRIEAATRNLESARVVLGHRSARVTEGYVRRDDREAAELMAKLG